MGGASVIGASLFRGVPSLSRVGYVSCNPPRYGLYLCLHTLNDDDISLYALHLTLPSKDNEPTHDLVYFTFSSEFWSWVFFIDTILVVGIRQKTHNSENTAENWKLYLFGILNKSSTWLLTNNLFERGIFCGKIQFSPLYYPPHRPCEICTSHAAYAFAHA